MRRLIIAAALTATVGLGAVASTAQAQYRYDARSYYGPYQSRYGYDYDDGQRYSSRDHDRYRYRDRYDDRYDLGRYDRNRYDRDRYDRYDRYYRYDRGPYSRNYYYRDNYYRYDPYRSGYRGIYVNPNRGLNINTGRFRFRLGW